TSFKKEEWRQFPLEKGVPEGWGIFYWYAARESLKEISPWIFLLLKMEVSLPTFFIFLAG
ncbi:MAG: hypothetical protein ACI9P8_001946, partial [Bacteroidia bacterium]